MKKALSAALLCLVLILTACSNLNQSTATTTIAPTSTTQKPAVASTAAATTIAATTTTKAASTTAATTKATTAAPLNTTAATSTIAAATTKPINILTGTYQKAEWGDYLHIYVKGDDGKDYNFFVLKYPGLDVETLKAGQKLKVTWQNVDELLNPPGKIVNFDKAIKVELIK